MREVESASASRMLVVEKLMLSENDSCAFKVVRIVSIVTFPAFTRPMEIPNTDRLSWDLFSCLSGRTLFRISLNACRTLIPKSWRRMPAETYPSQKSARSLRKRERKTHAAQENRKNNVYVAFQACGRIFRADKNVAEDHIKNCKNRVFG